MKKTILVVFAVLFFSGFAVAVSGNEAVHFVVQEKNFLYEGEKFEQPIVPISHENEKFWVIPILSGSSIVTFFPVKEAAKQLSASRPVNRSVFETADVLRELSLEKQKISSSSVQWIFTPSYSLRFVNLSNVFNNEVFQLNTIASSFDSLEAAQHVSKMNSALEGLSLQSKEIASLVLEASSLESDFFAVPDTQKAFNLKEKYLEVTLEISNFNNNALDYRKKVDEFKQFISLSNLDVSDKTQFISLADPPQEFNAVGNYVIDALELSQSIESVYNRVHTRSDILLNEFELRLLRQDAFDLVYGQNALIKEKTSGEFSTLPDLVNYILSEENRGKWINSSLVLTVEDRWRETQQYFNQNNYSLAKSFSQKVVADALSVYRQGFVETQAQNTQSNDLIFQVIFGLAVLLVLLLVYNNRSRILSFSKNKDDEDVFESEVD